MARSSPGTDCHKASGDKKASASSGAFGFEKRGWPRRFAKGAGAFEFVSVELTYRDGSVSEIKSFRR
jgi:hypothetical protein